MIQIKSIKTNQKKKSEEKKKEKKGVVKFF